jgi:hypothetical protein
VKSAEIKAEIARLEAKLSASDDKDIIDALQGKIALLRTNLESILESENQLTSETSTTKTETKIDEVELQKLLARARMYFTQKKWSELDSLLKQLETENSDHPNILELRAETHINRKENLKALQVLKKARKLAPQDRNIEKRLAEVAILADSSSNLDMMLRNGSDSLLIGQGDITAGATYATIYSLILPGSGHIVIGQSIKGIVMMISWLSCIVYLLLHFNSNSGSIRNDGFSQIGMIPISIAFVAALIHMVAIFECAARAKTSGKRQAPSRPVPPSNLPFE